MMDERKQLFLMLVQTYAMTKVLLRGNGGANLPMDVVAEAAMIDIEKVPEHQDDDDSSYVESARDYVDCSLRNQFPTDKVTPDWTLWWREKTDDQPSR